MKQLKIYVWIKILNLYNIFIYKINLEYKDSSY